MIIYLLYPFCRLWYYYRGLKFNHALYRDKTFNRGSKFIINESQNLLKAQTHLQHWLLIINTFGIKAQTFINLSLLAIAWCDCWYDFQWVLAKMVAFKRLNPPGLTKILRHPETWSFWGLWTCKLPRTCLFAELWFAQYLKLCVIKT